MTHRPDDPFSLEDEGRVDDDDLFGRRDPRDRRKPRAMGDFVRKAIETVGSVSSSGSVGREAIDYLLRTGDKGRKELFRIVANEVGDFLKNVDLSGEVVKVLSSLQVEFNATLRFRPTGEGTGVDASESEAKVSVGLAEKEKGGGGDRDRDRDREKDRDRERERPTAEPPREQPRATQSAARPSEAPRPSVIPEPDEQA